MDGIETAAEIQYQLKIPVIFLTAHADDTTIIRAKATSALGYLVKPVRQSDLKAALEIGLSIHHFHTALHRTDAWLGGRPLLTRRRAYSGSVWEGRKTF